KHMKRELKGKMKGKTKAQRKAIFKAAAKSYKSKGTRSKSSTGRAGSSNKTKSKKGRTQSTGGSGKVGRKGFSLSKIFKFVRLGALAMPAAQILMEPGADMAKKGRNLQRAYFGVEPTTGKFDFNMLARGWMPFIGATLITYGIPKITGLLRSL
ncbi:unnamed protein product, partial [marine sediment metagenome]